MWFKRNDGVLMCAEENSASFQMMMKSAEFAPCDEDGNEISLEVIESDVANSRTQSNSGQSSVIIPKQRRKQR